MMTPLALIEFFVMCTGTVQRMLSWREAALNLERGRRDDRINNVVCLAARNNETTACCNRSLFFEMLAQLLHSSIEKVSFISAHQ